MEYYKNITSISWNICGISPGYPGILMEYDRNILKSQESIDRILWNISGTSPEYSEISFACSLILLEYPSIDERHSNIRNILHILII